MKLLNIVVLTTSLLCATPSIAVEEEGRSLKNTSSIAYAIIRALPDSSLKRGLTRYYSILKPDSYYSDVYVGTKNDGIQTYFQNNFKSNSCFAETAYLFYNDIKNSTLNRQDDSVDLQRHSRASFGDIAGETRKDLEVGWLFKKALSYSGGDANKAMSLIGLCGHDDINQGEFMNHTALANVHRKYGLTHQGLYEDPLEQIELDAENPGNLCPPRTSDFYVSKSLDKEADISNTLKQRILNIQYPNRRPVEIASKNYHILNSAFMTCQMIEAGMNSKLAVKVQVAASNLYRGVRLCSDIRTPAKIYADLLKEPNIANKIRWGSSIAEALEETLMETIRKGQCSKYSEEPVCRFIDMATLPLYDNNEDLRHEVQSTIATSLPHMLAARLYLDWHAGGSLLGQDLPCSKIKISGPAEFFKALVLQRDIPLNLCGSSIAPADCKEAMKIIDTWRIDFDWTVEQHRAGAEFAAKNCKRYPKNETSFQNFCGSSRY